MLWRDLRQKPRTRLKQTRSNTPEAIPPITTEEPAVRRSRQLNPETAAPRPTGEPNSACIPLHQPNIITQAVIWTPNKYLQFDPTITGTNAIDIEYFCLWVVHPTAGGYNNKLQEASKRRRNKGNLDNRIWKIIWKSCTRG